jgi:ABC-type polysaccharide/polyol phosphate export permease
MRETQLRSILDRLIGDIIMPRRFINLEPGSRAQEAGAATVFDHIRHLIRYREAVRTLVVRDLTVRYSNSLLGVLWSLLHPLLMMAVFTVLFTFFWPSGIDKYPIYILAGLLPWNFFSGATLGAVASIVNNAPLISRVYFPRDILPISTVLSNLVNFLLALLLLLGLALVYRIPLGASLVFLPVVIFIQCLFSLGLGLFLSALNVHFRDTQQIMEVLILAWFFLTPVLYPIDLIQNLDLRLALKVANPIASLVVAYRDILYAGRMPELTSLLITTAEVLGLLVFGYWFFHKTSPSFAEEL